MRLERHYSHGLGCDRPGCDARFHWPQTAVHAPGERTSMQQATEVGWRIFVGRSQRHYCPAHGPTSGHTMREVTLR